MRLIDADALKQTWLFTGDNSKAYRDEIDDAPTIDAVPVNHGKWIPRYIKIAGRDFIHGMQCSVCAEPALDDEGDDYLTDYCPWCGARMDEE